MTIEAKEYYGHISIILEIVAFFLVTLDLYGKDNLKKLNELIRKSDKWVINPKVVIILFALWIVIVILNYSWFLRIGIMPQNLIIPYSIIYFFAAIITTIPMIACIYLIGWIFSGLLYLINLVFPIQGLMLITGTTLFLIAKYIQYLTI